MNILPLSIIQRVDSPSLSTFMTTVRRDSSFLTARKTIFGDLSTRQVNEFIFMCISHAMKMDLPCSCRAFYAGCDHHQRSFSGRAREQSKNNQYFYSSSCLFREHQNKINYNVIRSRNVALAHSHRVGNIEMTMTIEEQTNGTRQLIRSMLPVPFHRRLPFLLLLPSPTASLDDSHASTT